MASISSKERLLGVLQKKKMDRPPVACTGGMMNAAIVEIMSKTGHRLPESHHDDRLMAELAFAVHEHTGFENIGIPFDVTVEADVMGSEIDYGSLSCEPKVVKEKFSSVSKAFSLDIDGLLNSKRISTIVQAGYRLSRKYPDIPVIGNIAGPITTAASVVDPVSFLKELRKDKENSHRVIDHISDFLIAYARLMVDNGATLISIGDPYGIGRDPGPEDLRGIRGPLSEQNRGRHPRCGRARYFAYLRQHEFRGTSDSRNPMRCDQHGRHGQPAADEANLSAAHHHGEHQHLPSGVRAGRQNRRKLPRNWSGRASTSFLRPAD